MLPAPEFLKLQACYENDRGSQINTYTQGVEFSRTLTLDPL
jgi:hypothetical protein